MLRISSVWRIRQIKFQKQSKKCKDFTPVLWNFAWLWTVTNCLWRDVSFSNAALRIGFRRRFFWMEHKNQKKNQKNAKSSKNNSIDDLFHMKDNDFSFWFHEDPPFYIIYEFTEQICMTNIHTCGKIKIAVCKRKLYDNKPVLLTVGRRGWRTHLGKEEEDVYYSRIR